MLHKKENHIDSIYAEVYLQFLISCSMPLAIIWWIFLQIHFCLPKKNKLKNKRLGNANGYGKSQKQAKEGKANKSLKSKEEGQHKEKNYDQSS